MHLNLPILDQVSGCQNLLIAGMGGGFDVFCGLPIYFELRGRGQMVHLANFSFADVAHLADGIRLTSTLAGITPDHERREVYFPELFLARWFKEKRGEDVPIWCFEKTGARALLENYETLVDHLSIDGILLIDGGVDSLMRGDEAGLGTIVEDALSLAAVNELKHVRVRLIGCVGFGAETGVSYAHVFENIAALTKLGAFWGSCALLQPMDAYQLYEDAVLFVQSREYQDPSVINSSIISSVRGHYGNYHLTKKTAGSQLWISPLMPLYWFFDLPVVARRSLILSQLRWTDTFREAVQVVFEARQLIPKRPPAAIPLP